MRLSRRTWTKYLNGYFLLEMALLIGLAEAQIVHVWDLGDRVQAGQFTIYNPDINDAEFGTPVAAGDLNGDGLDDLAISAMAGDGPDYRRSNAGEVSIYFSTGRIEGELDLASVSKDVVTIYGEEARDIFGIKTHFDDVTGDGLTDLLVGAFYADVETDEGERLDAGKLYIFSASLMAELLAGDRVLDLAQEWPAGVGVVYGPAPSGRLGVWMASGDVNGDGFADVIVGADQAAGFAGRDGGAGAMENGRAYVLYGPMDADARVDLERTDHPMSVVYGIDEIDHAGSTVASGDINGDGFADVVVCAAALGTMRNAYDRHGGAGDGPDNKRLNTGELYVVFGRPDLPAHVDLRDDPPPDLLVIYGADGGRNSPDRLGEEVVLADVNGDGLDDLLIGAYRADGPGNSRKDAGEVYVVYGAADLPGRVLDMADPPPGTTVIYGARAGAIIGDSMAAGDIHGDGYADLFVGVPGDEGPLQRSFSGGIAVIAGAPDLPGEIDLLDPQVPVVWVQAPDHFDFAAYWSASGDLDGDGCLDVIPNGMAGDGPNNRRDNAGEAHVISGRYLAQFLPGEPVTVIGERTAPIPAGFQLYPAYPNPFNSAVRIPYKLVGDGGQYSLDIFSSGGQRLQRLALGRSRAGYYEAVWDGRDSLGEEVAAGLYVARLAASGDFRTTRLIFLK